MVSSSTSAGTYTTLCSLAAGNYTITYSPGTLTINQATATVTLSNLTQTYTGSPLTPTATTVPAGLAIVWTGAPDTNAGSYAVTVTVNDTNYQGSASGPFTINPASQTITFPGIPTQTGPGTITLTATASSGLTVSYSVISGPATVIGNLLTTTASGTVTVMATQAGNTNYLAATPVSQTFTITANASVLNGTNCNGEYTGTYQGSLTVSVGQVCTFTSGGVNGNVTQSGGTFVLQNNSTITGRLQVNAGTLTISNGGVTGNMTQNGGTVVMGNNSFVTGNLQMNRGSLTISNSTVGNDLQINGGGSFSIGPAVSIGGNLQIRNLPVSAGTDQVCGSSVHGDFQFHDNGTALLIGTASPGCAGNTVGGNLQVQNNTAPVTVVNNMVGGDLTVQHNSAATTVDNNTVHGNLTDQNNFAALRNPVTRLKISEMSNSKFHITTRRNLERNFGLNVLIIFKFEQFPIDSGRQRAALSSGVRCQGEMAQRG